MLDWKKLYVRQTVYFPNGYCRRRRGFRDGTFRHRLASTRVQPKTYRHRGEPCGNAYDRASHRSSPARAKLGIGNFRAGKPGVRCVSYFTLRIIIILMETIKDLIISPRALFNCASHTFPP